MADQKSRELSIKVDVDVSEALTGLKAVQREAKKAVQSLREVESESSNGIASMTNMPEVDAPISTKDIIDHLKYWKTSNIEHELNNPDKNPVANINPSMTMYDAIVALIKSRREFYGGYRDE